MSFGELKERKKNIFTNIARIDAIEKEENPSTELSILRALRKREFEELLLREEVC